jgi:hypothetical protein
MKTVRKCRCGNPILINRLESYTVVNRQRICVACARNGKLVDFLKGARSFEPSRYHLARFETLCSLQRRKVAA